MLDRGEVREAPTGAGHRQVPDVVAHLDVTEVCSDACDAAPGLVEQLRCDRHARHHPGDRTVADRYVNLFFGI